MDSVDSKSSKQLNFAKSQTMSYDLEKIEKVYLLNWRV